MAMDDESNSEILRYLMDLVDSEDEKLSGINDVQELDLEFQLPTSNKGRNIKATGQNVATQNLIELSDSESEMEIVTDCSSQSSDDSRFLLDDDDKSSTSSIEGVENIQSLVAMYKEAQQRNRALKTKLQAFECKALVRMNEISNELKRKGGINDSDKVSCSSGSSTDDDSSTKHSASSSAHQSHVINSRGGVGSFEMCDPTDSLDESNAEDSDSDDDNVESVESYKQFLKCHGVNDDTDIDFHAHFLSPYFRDGPMPCPPNQDQIIRDSLQPIPITYDDDDEDETSLLLWDSKAVKQMEDAMRDTMVNEYLALIGGHNPKEKKDKSEILERIHFIRNAPFNNVFAGCDFDSFDWKSVSCLLPTSRSAEDCSLLWETYLKPSVNKDSWTKEENEDLLRIAKMYNYQNWNKIAEELNTGRTGYLCFIQFQRKLYKPNHEWSDDEFSLLRQVVDACRIGDDVNWSKVMYYFDDYSFGQLYYKYYKSLGLSGKDIRKGKFGLEEDKILLKAKDGNLSMPELSALLPSRNSVQIRERFNNNLAFSDKNFGGWTEEEDLQLLRLVDEYGVGNWAKIARAMKCRSRTQVRQHYDHLKRTSKNSDLNAETYRKRKLPIKRKWQMREAIKRLRLEEGRKMFHKNELSLKNKEDEGLLNYFSCESKVLESRQSVGVTFDKNEQEILKIINLLGIDIPPMVNFKTIEKKCWHEYIFEAVKFLSKRINSITPSNAFENRLTLLPPNLVSLNTLKNLTLENPEKKAIYEMIGKEEESSDPNFKEAIEKWYKRLFIIFSSSMILEDFPVVMYNNIIKPRRRKYNLKL